MTANAITNRISLNIADADLASIQAAVKTLQDLLQPHLIALGADDVRGLAKMGPKSVDFVTKTLVYTRANPGYAPTFVDVDEFERDLDAVSTLRGLQMPLQQITDMVNSSLLLSGSEAFAAALACYQSFKAAAKLKLPNSVTIYSDLSGRWPGRAVTKPATAVKGVEASSTALSKTA